MLLRPVGATQLTLVYSGTPQKASLSLPTEAQIITSDTVLSRVAKDLDLANDVRFSPFASKAHRVDPDEPAVRAELLEQLRQGLSIQYSEFKSVPKEGRRNRGYSQGGNRSGSAEPGERIAYLTFSAVNPTLAAAILRSIVRIYQERSFELRHDSVMRVADRLTSSMEDFKKKVEAEQRELLVLQQQSGITVLPGGTDVESQELQILLKQQGIAGANARLAKAGQMIATGPGNTAGRPQPFDDSVDMVILRNDVNTARLELEKGRLSLGSRNPTVQGLQAKVRASERELTLGQSRLEAQVKARLDRARYELDALGAEIRSKAGKLRSHQEAARFATTIQVRLDRDSELYYVLVNNVRTAEIDAGYGSVNVELLKQAETPDQPRAKDYPIRLLEYAGEGLVAGIVLVSILGLISNGGLTTIQMVEHELRMPAFARFPFVPVGTPAETQASSSDPRFMAAIGMLCERVRLSPASNATRCIAFTKASPRTPSGEIALRVAAALAGPDCRTLLIDADWQNPSMRELAGGRSTGLGDVLRARLPLRDAIVSDVMTPGLDVVACGAPVSIPFSPMALERLRVIMEQSELVYRYVFILTGCIQQSEGGEELAAMADLGLLVLPQGRLSSSKLMKAGDALRGSGVRLTGFVLADRGVPGSNRSSFSREM